MLVVVSSCRRSVSLPKPNIMATSTRPYHVRSSSLPCRSHPSISQLQDQIHNLKAWQSDPARGSSSWLCAGLILLTRLHDSLDDLFHLPQAHHSLRRLHNLLETSLLFVDAYGSFRAALAGLKEAQVSAQVAIRRRDGSSLSSCVKSRRKIESDVARIATEIRKGRQSSVPVAADPDAEMAWLVREANAVTVSVSVAVFCGVSLSSSSKASSNIWRKRNKMDGGDGVREFRDAWGENLGRWKEDEKMALRRLKVCEEWVVEIEKGSERLFRSLLNARVSLLNVLTQLN